MVKRYDETEGRRKLYSTFFAGGILVKGFYEVIHNCGQGMASLRKGSCWSTVYC